MGGGIGVTPMIAMAHRLHALGTRVMLDEHRTTYLGEKAATDDVLATVAERSRQAQPQSRADLFLAARRGLTR